MFTNFKQSWWPWWWSVSRQYTTNQPTPPITGFISQLVILLKLTASVLSSSFTAWIVSLHSASRVSYRCSLVSSLAACTKQFNNNSDLQQTLVLVNLQKRIPHINLFKSHLACVCRWCITPSWMPFLLLTYWDGKNEAQCHVWDGWHTPKLKRCIIHKSRN